jgi:hypothetical protein
VILPLLLAAKAAVQVPTPATANKTKDYASMSAKRTTFAAVTSADQMGAANALQKTNHVLLGIFVAMV